MDYKLLKRVVDFLGALLLLLVLFPVYTIIFLLILFIDRQNPIFKQIRPGLHGKPFTIYKFRTMRSDKPSDVELKNLTRFGAFIRNHSIDELPQLINVLIGNMSFIGPRPLLLSYLTLYSEQQFCRHNVKPGMTGLAQISGRNSLDWETKFNFDLMYVENISIGMDVKILLKTLRIIFNKQHINASDSITVQPFNPTQTTTIGC